MIFFFNLFGLQLTINKNDLLIPFFLLGEKLPSRLYPNPFLSLYRAARGCCHCLCAVVPGLPSAHGCY